MGEWQVTELGNLPIKIIDGDRGSNYPKKTEFYPSGYCLFLNTKNVTNRGFEFAELNFIDESKDSQLRNGKLKRGDVVLTTRGTVGNVAYYNSGIPYEQIRINSGMIIVRPDGIDEQYNFQLFKYLRPEFLAFSTGSAQPQLPIRDLKGIPIVLPSVPEQKAIAEVLSSLDDKIDLLHRQNKTLEALAETLFREWFSTGADDSWQTVRVSDVAKTNASTLKANHAHQQIQYLDTGSITEGKIEALQPYDLKDAPSRAKRLVRHNDIIISTVRPNHKHYGFIKKPRDDLVVSTCFCVVTCDSIDPHFMYLLLTQPDMTEYLSMVAEASTSTYPSLKPSDIEAIEFQMPPEDLLNKFSVIASDSWDKIEANYQQIRYLEKLRDTLLPKLMSGDVRVEYDEAA